MFYENMKNYHGKPTVAYLFLWLKLITRTDSWQTQQNDCAPSEGSDLPGHPPSLIRVFACTPWVAKDLRFLHADSEGSDQTGRMPRLIWAFAGRTVTLLVLSCRGSCTRCKSDYSVNLNDAWNINTIVLYLQRNYIHVLSLIVYGFAK